MSSHVSGENKFKSVLKLSLAMVVCLSADVNWSYVNNLEKKDCKCSEDWKRKWLKYGTLILMILKWRILDYYVIPIIECMIYIILLNNLSVSLSLYFENFLPKAIHQLINIMAMYIYSSYLYNLMKKDCKCSEDWRRKFIIIPICFILFPSVVFFF